MRIARRAVLDSMAGNVCVCDETTMVMKGMPVYNTMKKETGVRWALCELGGDDALRRRSESFDGVTESRQAACRHLQDSSNKRKVASSNVHVSTCSCSGAWIASMSLHRDLLGHATDSAGDAPESLHSATAMPPAVGSLLDSMRTWHGR